MLQEYGQNIVQFLIAHPNWGGFITFLIAFSESLAIIGTIIPGSVTMTAVGLLVGTGIMPLGLTLLWAVLGAFLGDLLGYWIGMYYNESLRNMWPFKKHPGWLDSGERFFQKHGGKSIIIGRFIGPIRSLIPLVAGLLRMPFQKFIFAAIPAATLWAIAYMLPGILIGALSLQLPPGMATRFILFFFLIIILLTIVGWTFKNVFLFISKHADRLLQNIWLNLRQCHKCQWFVRLIENKKQPESHQQLGLFTLGLIAFFIFLIIIISIKTNNLVAWLNVPTFELLRSLRHTQGDKVMMAFTILGSANVLIPAGLGILVWLMVIKKWRAALHWLIVMSLGVIIPVLLKHVIFSPRPTGLLNGPTSNSFPSGHTFLSLVYFGFLASLFSTHLKNGLKNLPYYIASFIIVLVALSRLYLGVHWVTDVVGSLALGLCCIVAVLLSYRRNISQNINLMWFGITVITLTILSWCIYFVPHYEKMLINHTPIWPETIITLDDWWSHGNEVIPLYRMNRFGKASEPINIQWLGQANDIEQTLIQQGWKKYSVKNDLSYIIEKVGVNNKVHPTSLFSVYYNNNLPIMVLTKSVHKNKHTLVLRLWSSNVNFLDNNKSPLLLGILASSNHHHGKNKISYKNVFDELILDLKNFLWQEQNIPLEQKAIIPNVKWDGKILQIKSPSI